MTSRISILCKAVLVTTSLLAACAKDEPPSCQQAFSHYYEAGCSFYDLQTDYEYSEGEMNQACREIKAAGSTSCIEAIDDWLICLNDVPSATSSNSACDCSQDQEQMLSI